MIDNEDNENATSLTPGSGLSGIQFSILNVLKSLIPGGTGKKYKNTYMKSENKLIKENQENFQNHDFLDT